MRCNAAHWAIISCAAKMSGLARWNLIILFEKDGVCVKVPNLSKARHAWTQTKQLTQRGLIK
jgi:hypothetical protein